MSTGGEWDFGGLTVAVAPLLIIFPKDINGKPVGESFLIPVKNEAGKWRFELKDTYGVGGEYVKKFAQKLEQTLREKNKDYYEGVEEIVSGNVLKGTLPESKNFPFLEDLKFYRDGEGEVELKKFEQKSEKNG
jgi:hypothetical protein